MRGQLWALMLLVILAGVCGPPRALSAGDDSAARQHAAAQLLPGEFDFFFVESAGLLADTAFISKAKVGGPSPLAVRLGVAMVNDNAKAEALAISGPSAAKTEQVIKDAFRSIGREALPHLHIVYVGNASAGKTVKKIVEKHGARFTLVSY